MLPADYRERQYVSQYATDLLGLVIHKAGVPADADGDVTMTLISEDTDPHSTVASRVANHLAVGTYETALTSAESAVPGLYTVHWSYAIDAVPQTYETYIQVGTPMPDYDRLAPGMKDIVDSVWIRFADLFDSPQGGPNLQTYFQQHFGRGRIAQLLRISMGRLNTMAQPFQTYTLDDGQGGASFPITQWGSLLETATYVEAVKHLVRSYVEQPNVLTSGSVSRLDRRDYMDRWASVLRDEEEMLQRQLEVFKISNMGLGRPAVLVSGGVYGRYGPTRIAGSVAARPRYWTRWY